MATPSPTTGPTTGTTATMRAVVQERYGSADVLHLAHVDRPEPRKDEVLLRVRAAGLDRGTWHVMTGQPYLGRLAFGLRRPRNPVPGLDVAGTVVAHRSRGDPVGRGGRGLRLREGHVRGVRRRPRGQARQDAGQPLGRAGRGGPGVRVDGTAGVRHRPRRARSVGAGHRGVRWRRLVRRAAREGARCGGHRHVQHRQARPGALARRRPRPRLHLRRLRGRHPPLRRDPRRGREPDGDPVASGPHADGHGGRRRGRGRRLLDRHGSAAEGRGRSRRSCGSGWRCSSPRSVGETWSG